MRFIPVHFEHLAQLEGNLIAELYFEYLVLCNQSPYTEKSPEGYFIRSISQIQSATMLTRTTQLRAKKTLVSKGWISCKPISGKSMGFKIHGCQD